MKLLLAARLAVYALVPAMFMAGTAALAEALEGHEALGMIFLLVVCWAIVFSSAHDGFHEIEYKEQLIACGVNLFATAVCIALVTSMSAPLRSAWSWKVAAFCAVAWLWAGITGQRGLQVYRETPRVTTSEPVDTLATVEHADVNEVDGVIATLDGPSV